jgi:hypothetical protein
MKEEIKETCGFLDLNQNFHKNKKEAEYANLKIKAGVICRKLDNFHESIISLWDRTEYDIYQQDMGHTPPSKLREKLLEDLCKVVLHESDNFISIIQEKKNLEKELDTIKKLHSNKDWWWLKSKWW